MEFYCETVYDRETMTDMAKALRKTVRKKRNRWAHLWGGVVLAAAILLTLPHGGQAFVLDFRRIITWIAAAVVLLTMIFADRLNGYVAKRRMLPGMERAAVTFREDGYHSETELGSSDFKYESIAEIVETEKFFVFIFGQNHAHAYDKCRMTGGTADEFRVFLKTVTGKDIQKV